MKKIAFVTALIISALLTALLTTQISFAVPITDAGSAVREVPKVKRDETPPEPLVSDALQNSPGNIAAPDPYSDKTLKNTFFLYRLQEDLKDAQNDYRGLNSAVFSVRKKLEKTQEQIFTFKEQVSFFNDRITESEKKLLNVADQIALKEQEMTKLSDEIDVRKMALAEQKNLLSSYLRMQYVQENLYAQESHGQSDSQSDEAPSLSTVKILLADQSVGETVQNIYSVSLFQEAASQMLEKLDSDTRLFEGMQMNLENKKKRLDSLEEKLHGEQDKIQEQKFAKAVLLQQTRGDEERYQRLIVESLYQQEEGLLEIRALQDNMRYVQRKIRDFGTEIDFADLKNLVDQRTKEFYEYQLLADTNAEFQWPISPTRGISAFFQDSRYRARFGIPHNAIDIPVMQGSAIRAAKDGYVYKVKDNGMGYSYIILSHKDQFTTVYGHVSEILVAEDAFVKAGDVIGLSGGIPGTKGAGYLTTGAHVHFEILKEGRYVDPLNFLSLTKLTLEQLPEKYVRKIEEQSHSESVLPENKTEALTRDQLPELLEEAERREHEVLEKEQSSAQSDTAAPPTDPLVKESDGP